MLNLTLDFKRTCNSCKTTKLLDHNYFDYTKSNKTGFNYTCKNCRSINRTKSWQENKLYCYKCKKYKLQNDFRTITAVQSIVRNNKSRTCITCSDITRKNQKIHSNSYTSRHGLKYVLKQLTYGAKKRSKEKNISFDLTIKTINQLWGSQNGLCAITGTPMTYETHKGRVNTNVSIDRKNPKLGYTIENVQLVCNIVNVMKYTMTIEELKTWCNKILTYGQIP